MLPSLQVLCCRLWSVQVVPATQIMRPILEVMGRHQLPWEERLLEVALGAAAGRLAKTVGVVVARATAHSEPSRGVCRPKLRQVLAPREEPRQGLAQVALVVVVRALLAKRPMSEAMGIKGVTVERESAAPLQDLPSSMRAEAVVDRSQEEPSQPVAVESVEMAARFRVRKPIRVMVRPIPDRAAVVVDRDPLLR